MSRSSKTSGPQFRADRPEEQEAVRTTIVGGRPPGSGKPLGPIPRGIDVLVKKASIDPAFRALLLSDRSQAADEIGLQLDPAESAMLAAVPSAQLAKIIDRTTVPEQHRRAFLGKAAAAMLATMGIATAGCPLTLGSRPEERPERVKAPAGADPGPPPDEEPEPEHERPRRVEPSHGDRPPPDEPEPPSNAEPAPSAAEQQELSAGIRPEPPPPTKGIRPDLPSSPKGGVRPDLPPGAR
jgi:hypothetical protein